MFIRTCGSNQFGLRVDLGLNLGVDRKRDSSRLMSGVEWRRGFGLSWQAKFIIPN